MQILLNYVRRAGSCPLYGVRAVFNRRNHVISGGQLAEPLPKIPLFDYIWRNRNKFADRPAYTCLLTETSATYEQLYNQSVRFGGGLKSLGYRRGDVVAACLPNCLQFPVYVHGCMSQGLVASPMNPASTQGEIEYYLKLANAKAVVTWPGAAEAVLKAAASVPHVRHVINSGDVTELCAPPSAAQVLSAADVMAAGGQQQQQQEGDRQEGVAADAVDRERMLLMFSSGTTGLPKAVSLTSANFLANIAQCLQPDTLWERAERERFIGLLPMFHVYGMHVFAFKSLCLGAETCLLPAFDPKTLEPTLRDFKPTTFHVVPPLVDYLNSDAVSGASLDSLDCVIVGAAPIGANAIQRFHDKSGGRIRLGQGYGLTETSPVLTASRLEGSTPATSCGRLLPATQLQVRHVETAAALPANCSGQLCFRGPQVFREYYNNEEATRATIDVDGWILTGDVGHYDSDGNVFIVDRLKELIKYKGSQVAPAVLEDLLRGHPAVTDVAVVGLPHERDGELACAFVVRSPAGGSCTAQQLQLYVAERVSRSQQLHGGVRFVDRVPRSASGKILRRLLRENAAQSGVA